MVLSGASSFKTNRERVSALFIDLRIAIFGGTFDPVHQAHLAVARTARDLFFLDKVLVVPAAHPPHKLNQYRESYEHRFQMVELACRGERGLEASRLEAGLERSYSIHTIERIRDSLSPADRLFFLIGADAFAEVTTWHRWQDVLEQVEFIVVSRPGHSYAVPSGAVVHRLDSVEIPISSSEIRRDLHSGGPVLELPPRILRYIRQHNLYSGLSE